MPQRHWAWYVMIAIGTTSAFSSGHAGECDRSAIKSEKLELSPATLGYAEFRSMAGKIENAGDFTYLYCVKNVDAPNPFRFQWFKSDGNSSYFDSYVNVGMELAAKESALTVPKAGDRRALYNYSTSRKAETVYMADEAERLAGITADKVQFSQKVADVFVPLSDDVVKNIASGDYKYAENDFIRLRLAAQAFIDKGMSGELVYSNAFSLTGAFGKQPLPSELEALNRNPIRLVGDVGVFGMKEISLDAALLSEPVVWTLPVPNSQEGATAKEKRISLQTASGTEVGSFSFVAIVVE